MSTTSWIIIGFLFVIGYFIVSPDPFASAIRAKIPFLQRKAANAVDSVDTRIEAAKAAQASTVRSGRKSLYDIQIELASSKGELDRVSKEIVDDSAALALARSKGDRETFDILVKEFNKDTAFRTQLLASHEQVVEQLKTLEVAVDEQQAKKDELEIQGRLMVSQARVNDVIAAVNEAKAGLNDNGADSQMAEAQRILDRTTARAQASQAAAEGLTQSERDQRKADAYIKQAQSGVSQQSADELWNKMGEEPKPAS